MVCCICPLSNTFNIQHSTPPPPPTYTEERVLCPVKANEADFLDALRDMAPDLMAGLRLSFYIHTQQHVFAQLKV